MESDSIVAGKKIVSLISPKLVCRPMPVHANHTEEAVAVDIAFGARGGPEKSNCSSLGGRPLYLLGMNLCNAQKF